MRIRCLAFALAVLGPALTLVPVAEAAPRDDEIVEEFKRYFKKYKDTESRVEAILSLEGVEAVGVVEVLVPVLRKGAPEEVRAAVRVLARFESEPPRAALLTELEETKKSTVRAGILRAIARSDYQGIAEPVRACLDDRDGDVRRRAVEALGASGESSAVEAIVPLCEDPEVFVRCAALDALARLGSPAVLEPARAQLADESWRVRASAIAALGKVRDKGSIEPLIERLALEEGRLREDVGNALDAITGRTFGMRLESWRQFWDRWKDRYEIPTDEELRAWAEKRAANAEKYTPPGTASFGGVATPSQRLVFVIDVSGSMEEKVLDTDRFADGGYPSMKRIDIVKTELARTVERLEEYVEFNILAFATEIDPWKKRLVEANVLNKSSAASWIERLEAIGGRSGEEFHRAGLTRLANLEGGKTNTFGALMAALGGDSEGEPVEDHEIALDTIFFLSDGRPSEGTYTDPEDILREVRELNQLRRIVIHTIGIGDFQEGFLEALATQNGGVFVDLGK